MKKKKYKFKKLKKLLKRKEFQYSLLVEETEVLLNLLWLLFDLEFDTTREYVTNDKASGDLWSVKKDEGKHWESATSLYLQYKKLRAMIKDTN